MMNQALKRTQKVGLLAESGGPVHNWVTNEDDNATGSLMKSLWANRKGA